MLEFGGFTGRKGAGGTVHNEEMVYLGGMDLDIDSFFIFQSPGGAIEKHFRENKSQFTDENGVIIDSKPEENDKDYVVQLKDYEKHPLAAVDPRLLISASAGAYRGNRLLGIAAVAGRRGSSWHQAATKGDTAALRIVLTNSVRGRATEFVGANATDLEILIAPSKDKRAFDIARREAMNRAADAGDFPGFLKDSKTIGNFITKNLSSGIVFRWKDADGKQRERLVTSEDAREFFTPNKTVLWNRMRETDYLGNGRNYGGQMDMTRAWDAARKVIPHIGETPRDIDPSVEFSPEEAAQQIWNRSSRINRENTPP
jgi:hypothetical protein